MNFIKKHLKNIIMVLGSFVVINVAMFFFLKMTRPQVGPRSESAAVMDSTAPAGSVAEAGPPPATTLSDTAAVAAAADTVVRPMTVSDGAAKAEPPAEPTVASPPAVETPAEVTQAVTTETTDVETPEEEGTTVEEDSTLAAARAEEARELTKLAKLLESMKPNDAADIAAQLTTDQIIAVVMRMKDRTAGKLLAALPPETAARVAMQMSQVAMRGRDGS